MGPLPVIRNFKQYFWRKLVPALLIVTGGIFFLNFFLAYQLENTLRKEISTRVSDATDGFYALTFDDLKINLLNGELMIEGIHITPNSDIFYNWEAKDSLPLTYINASINRVDFKGINLIWLRNYRRLNFHSFEIDHPVVKITDAFYSDRHERKVPVKRYKTLYEYIEPYIDILSVDYLNIKEGSASFHVEHPLTPILYKIEDIDFYAYNFRLDSASFNNGNLLYSEDIEFISDHPQTILTNNHFLLQTDSILLNTRDSVIYLKDIHLIQQVSTNNIENSTLPYANGEISSVLLQGAAFKRENGFNTMQARLFEIDSSDVSVASHLSPAKSSIPKDTSARKDILNSLSLYDLISPVLNRLTIENIDIKNSTLDYAIIGEENTDRYKIDRLNLIAHDFRIDSLYEERYGIRYTQDIRLEASGLEGEIHSANMKIKAGSFMTDTGEGTLILQEASIDPIDRQSRKAIISGRLPLFHINGIKYNNGIAIGQLIAESPEVYYMAPSGNTTTNGNTTLFSPYMNYLHIEEVQLKRANLRFRERGKKDNWTIRDFDGFINGLKIDEQTIQTIPGFICDKIGLRLQKAEGILGEGKYRLQTGKGTYSTRSGIFDLRNITLTPSSIEEAGSSLQIEIPHIYITGAGKIWNTVDHIQLDSIQFERPDIRFQAANSKIDSGEIEEKSKEYTPFQPFLSLDIQHIGLNGTHLEYTVPDTEARLSVKYDRLNIEDIKWNLEKERSLDIRDFEVNSPDVEWIVSRIDSTSGNSTPQTIPEILYPYAEKLSLQHFFVDNIRLQTMQPYLATDFKVTEFELDSLEWWLQKEKKALETGAITISHPLVNITQKPTPQLTPKAENDTVKTTIYDQLKLLGDEISIHSLEVQKGNIHFTPIAPVRPTTFRNLNQTDFRIKELEMDNMQQAFTFEDIQFSTEDLSIPISQGFYTLDVSKAELHNGDLVIDNFHMNPQYPKKEFAYHHPGHKDWFDVTADRIHVEEFNLESWLSDSLVHIKKITVDNPFMQNFKNKQIYVPPKWMPMIYTGLQKAPVKIDIEEIQVNNFGVIYEELSKNGTEPGKLVFTELNGHVSGFTNIVSEPDQFIRLDADGKFYGEGHFNAIWLLPVDSLNDHFILEAWMPEMDLTLLNEMITPLASASLRGGELTDLKFIMDAGNIGGSIDLLLLYNGLKIDIFQIKEGEKKSKKFLNLLVNAVIRDNNPNNPGHSRSQPRHPYVIIERDPYHSSFNYLWQLLRPALIESVGVTQTQQNMAGGIAKFITKIKKLFKKEKTLPPDKEPAE